MTNNTRIDKWFPKLIYVAEDLLLDHLPSFEKEIKDTVLNDGYKSTGMQQVNSTHVTNDSLHTNPVFRPLITELINHVYEFMTRLGYSKEQIESSSIINMWANVSYQNNYLFPHVHPGSNISGAFYVKALPDSIIKFFDSPSMLVPPTTYNELNYEFCDYNCIPGRLILFKSDFLHGTPIQGDGEKIVISFNVR